jgi:hypothetical protein
VWVMRSDALRCSNFPGFDLIDLAAADRDDTDFERAWLTQMDQKELKLSDHAGYGCCCSAHCHHRDCVHFDWCSPVRHHDHDL